MQFYSVPSHSSPSTWYVFMSSLAYSWTTLAGCDSTPSFLCLCLCQTVSCIHTSAWQWNSYVKGLENSHLQVELCGWVEYRKLQEAHQLHEHKIVLVINAIIFGEHRNDALTNWAWSLLCSEVEDDGGPEVHPYHTVFRRQWRFQTLKIADFV